MSKQQEAVLKAESKQFGIVEYSPEDVIEFPLGLPAFERETAFLLIERPQSKPMVFLQSLARPELCFVTLPIRVVDTDYQLCLGAEDLPVLGVRESQLATGNLICLAIVSLTDSRPTANLLAPVVVNVEARRAVQAIRMDARYSHQHPVGELCS